MPILGIDASRAVKREKTGVEWYSFFLLKAMARQMPAEWQVRCYVPDESGIWNHESGNWQWRVLKWFGRGWTQGRLSLEMMKTPPDVLFVPAHALPLVHPVRTVTTVHDIIFVKHPELYAPDDLEAQKRSLDFALKFAKRIIVPTRAVREDVLAAGGKAEQVVVVSHGVDLEWRMESEELRIIESPYILFIGRIERKKNVLGLIHAFRKISLQFPELMLVLAGQLGFGGEDVMQALKTFKLEEKVLHLGWVSRDYYLTLLKHANLLVLPSFGEGFGFPVVEAMAAGVPAICSDLPALREVGGNAVQYVNPRSPEDIARGIKTVLQNPMLQTEMVKQGQTRAREFTWESCAKNTWSIITAL